VPFSTSDSEKNDGGEKGEELKNKETEENRNDCTFCISRTEGFLNKHIGSQEFRTAEELFEVLNTYYAKRDDCITMEPSIAFIRALKYSND
jgi:hypothetical protein